MAPYELLGDLSGIAPRGRLCLLAVPRRQLRREHGALPLGQSADRGLGGDPDVAQQVVRSHLADARGGHDQHLDAGGVQVLGRIENQRGQRLVAVLETTLERGPPLADAVRLGERLGSLVADPTTDIGSQDGIMGISTPCFPLRR